MRIGSQRTGLKTSFTRTLDGFILPVVIVLSLAIATVSVLALSTVSTSSKTLDDRYYTTLAHEAAQAGVVTATACVDASTPPLDRRQAPYPTDRLHWHGRHIPSRLRCQK